MPPTPDQPASGDLSFVDDRHSGNLIRLGRLLEHPDSFRLVLAEHNAPRYRDRIIEWLADRFPRSVTWPVASDLSAGDVIEHLGALGPEQEAVQVVGLEAWSKEAESRLFTGFNYRREDLAAAASCLLVLWLPKGAATRFAQEAPDLWAWRTAVLDFALAPPERMEVHERTLGFFGEDAERLKARRREIEEHLEAKGEPTHADGALLLEVARIHERFGEWDQALQTAEQALAIYRDHDDRRSTAVTQGKIADILRARGELDQALLIRTQEELPVYERLGDVHSKAVTQGRIADILQARGELDQALRIRTQEELPVYERLGDVRSKAMTQGKIADILRARGELDQALRIRTQEELPVYERLGDVHSKAVTQGRIADILQARGELDEALRIRTEEELPVYERLGDVRSKAVTQGKIADILQARGELDEALRIRTQEELPVYERLGDVRSKAVTQGKIADILQARGELDEALALHEQRLSVARKLGDIELVAATKFKVARIRLQRGDQETDAMQRIYEDLAEAFAIFRKLGRQDGIGHVGVLLAQVLAMRGRQDEALEVLDRAEAAFGKLGDTQGADQARWSRDRIQARRLG